ncbi:MAG: glycosyltransferase WbuB, partial [Candidatus Hydrogenedentes bacterium]|nr:glycosyltransferase WbuB [Candidatus Hydrogenedentota bacterium]
MAADPVRGRPRRALILVENLSVPFDRRVWRESLALREAGYQVAVICPRGETQDTERYACIEGVHIYRYRPYEATGSALSYLLEYGVAMIAMKWLTLWVCLRHGFDSIQLCNPPDTLILVALPYRLFGKRILFDQHDLSPDLYIDQKGGGSGGFMHRALLF